MSETSGVQKDFFISYTRADRQWAEWIAWQLEEEKYSVIIQEWDLSVGSNFVHYMNTAVKDAERTIAVLSPDYFTSQFVFAEWAVAFHRDPKGELGFLIPILVSPCDLEGLLGQIVCVDFVDKSEQVAKNALLAAVKRQRRKPINAPSYPPISHTLPEYPTFPGIPLIWNIPYPRNPVFTGREDVIMQISTALETKQVAELSQTQAISGLGGIGKTQIAIEYAYCSYQHYQAVFWTSADTREALVSGYVAIAELLKLPEKNEQDQTKIVEAVMHWLTTSTKWLLIMDNADDLSIVREFLPSVFIGHILLTTRAHTIGTLASRIEVKIMPQAVGALFLLRRAKCIAPNVLLEQASASHVATAGEICEELGGLPLAIDQAGAYIEETQCSLLQYLHLYRTRRTVLLQHHSRLASDYPKTVATTWSLAFEKIEQGNPVAADLLRLCSFLHPDAIPEEIITKGTASFGPNFTSISGDQLVLDKAIEALGAYSLIYRDVTLNIHRLVQAVLKDGMNEDQRQQWAERAVRAVNRTFPDVEVVTWSLCEPLLSHAQVCAELINEYKFVFLEATQLLTKAGSYLLARAQYSKAEPLLQRALAIHMEVLGSTNPSTASSIGLLGQVYQEQGKYKEAEPLLRQALEIHKQVLGDTHLDTMQSLSNLGYFYGKQGKYKEAEPLLEQSLAIHENVLGDTHSNTAAALYRLGSIYSRHGRYIGAEPLLQRALAIDERVRGSAHPDTIADLLDLGWVYTKGVRYKEAESSFQRALTIREQVLGRNHPETASSLDSLGWLYWRQGKYKDAEPLLQWAVAVREQIQGLTHPDTAKSLLYLGLIYDAQDRYEEAEQLCQRSIMIYGQASGKASLDMGRALGVYAYMLLKRYKIIKATKMAVRGVKALGMKEILRYTTETVRLYVMRVIWKQD